jgi:hypothetical protein
LDVATLTRNMFNDSLLYIGREIMRRLQIILTLLLISFSLSSQQPIHRAWTGNMDTLTSYPTGAQTFYIGGRYYNPVVENYNEKALALFQRMSIQPSDSVKIKISEVYDILMGIVDSVDAIYYTNLETEQQSCLNWVRDTFNLVKSRFPANGAFPDFIPYVGFDGNGESSYLSTGFNPSTTGNKYTINNCLLGVGTHGASVASTAQQIGGNDATNRSYFYIKYDSSNFRLGINSNGTSSVSLTADSGVFLAQRTASNLTTIYANTSDGVTSSRVSTGMPNIVYNIMATNANGSAANFCNDTIYCAIIGGALTVNQINRYMSATKMFTEFMLRQSTPLARIENRSSELLSQSYLKNGGVVIRFGGPNLAIANLFYKYNQSHTQAISGTNGIISLNNPASIEKMKAVANYNIDIGVWNHDVGTLSAFTAVPGMAKKYLNLDYGLVGNNKGINEIFVRDNGDSVILQNMIYKDTVYLVKLSDYVNVTVYPLMGTKYASITLNETSDIGSGGAAIYIPENELSVPEVLRGKYLTLFGGGAFTIDNYFECKYNGRIDIDEYADGFLSSTPFQTFMIDFDSYYTTERGFEYNLMSMNDWFNLWGLDSVVSTGEIETGGYASAEDETWTPYFNQNFKGATRAPVRIGEMSYTSPDTFRYRITATSGGVLGTESDPRLSGGNRNLIEAQKITADFFVKHKFWHDRELNYSSFWSSDVWDEYLLWATQNKILIVSYPELSQMLYDFPHDTFANVIPYIYTDICNEGKPTGWDLGDGVSWSETNGVEADSNYSFIFNTASDNYQLRVEGLGGIEKGDNTLSFYLKNDGTAEDELEFKIYQKYTTEYDTYTFTINNINYQEKTQLITIPINYTYDDSHLFTLEFRLKTKLSSGNVYLTGIRMSKNK